MISIIVATAQDNVIGKDNALIWHLPKDMKFFKEKTEGHCVITGRKNYESIPEKFRPLPNRTNIVVTRQTDYEAPGAIVVKSIQEALTMAENINIARETPNKNIFVIGGAEIYKQCLLYADRIYLTKIHSFFEGDTFFPEINESEWKESNKIEHVPDEKNKYFFDFITLDKIK